MLNTVGCSLRMLLAMTLVMGFVYPVVLTSFAQAVFPEQANGSLLYRESRAVGSRWIGQSFTSERYFHGRPSNAGDGGYDGVASAGSNLGPTSAALLARIGERVREVREKNGLPETAKVPSDLATASGSGLDPHITPEAAAVQVERVARARGLRVEAVNQAVKRHTENAQAGFMGDRRVNVLMLNMELDQLQK